MAGGTNFEGIEHPELKKMVQSTDPAKVLSRGTQLQSAGRVLKELGAALKSHIGNVTWEGPAAESFKTWAGNLQQSAALLGDYSAAAGDAMHQAGEALSTAKAAVPEPPHTDIATVNARQFQGPPNPAAVTKANNFSIEGGSTANIDSIMKKQYNSNWVSEADAQAAALRIYTAHQEAIHQMEKLGQAYEAATTKLAGLGDVMLPGTPDAVKSRDDVSDYSPGASGGGYGGSPRSPRTGGGSTSGSYSPSGGNYGGGSVSPRNPGSGPQGPIGPGHTDPIPPRSGGQVLPTPVDPGSSTPSSVPSDPINRPGTGLDSLPTVPTLPSQTGPFGPSGGGSFPTESPGGTPGYPGGPGGPAGTPGSSGFPGGGRVTGFPAGGSGSIPAKSGGGSIPGKGGGSIPARTVPFGGGPVAGKSGGTPGLPSGTVFGAREAQAGRAGTAGGTGGMNGMHPGMGGHGAGGSGGSSRGRGLTSTGGGTVGGRKGPATGGEFTPGGTGLRNRAAAAGAAEGEARSGQNSMMTPGTAGHSGRNERDRRKRADYLHEDEETWTSGTPHSNPDVIE
ncbi:WXG100 family type VII secretion target [Kitasatospora sp. NPDC087314]|uniref:WXG100 family type VII secretion target n=1 Tax=Kitasatospora sp. NPDC087314 TaxID=3364068 RepID=UPI003830A867